MPGVPSGRACDACRRQRKKCDQLTPACSRCSRLRIECTGAGTIRYKFQEDTRSGSIGSPASTQSYSSSATVSAVVSPRPGSPFQGGNIYSLSNDTTRLSAALVSNVKSFDNLKYHLSWTYGGFIEDIPRRLGTSEALDTAVLALLSAHSNVVLRTGDRYLISAQSLKHYSDALRTLRHSLDDPSQAQRVETLCAVMLLLICQGFLTTHTGCTSTHGEGARHILKARGYYNTNDEFESKLLLSLRGPLLIEALINPKIHFSIAEWKAIVENAFDGVGFEPLMMRLLTQLPDIMRQGRAALHDPHELGLLVDQTRENYELLNETLSQLRKRLVSLPNYNNEDQASTHTPTMNLVHAYFQRTFGLGLAICIAFNCILKALDRDITNSELELEAVSFGEDVLELARQASRYRPMGASFVTLCLIAAWSGCRNLPQLQTEIQTVLVDYMADFGEPVVESLEKELRFISDRLALLEV